MGRCEVRCSWELTNCGGVCRDIQSDRGNCGACGYSCGEGEVCDAGRCRASCAGALSDCDGVCVDLRNDPDHCGTCAVSCPRGTNGVRYCARGVCGSN